MTQKPRVGSETVPYNPISKDADIQPIDESQLGGLEHLLDEQSAEPERPKTPEEKQEAWKKAFLEIQSNLTELKRQTAQQEAERNAFIQAMPEKLRGWAHELIRLDEDPQNRARTLAPVEEKVVPAAPKAPEEYRVGELVEYRDEMGWRVDKVAGRDGNILEIGRMELNAKGNEVYKRELVRREEIKKEPR